MCVVREDLTEWLQDYLFSSENIELIPAIYLLDRLSSGLWLSRLAYKLHYSVFNQSKHHTLSELKLGAKKQFDFLNGPVSNPKLKGDLSFSLSRFPASLEESARLPLGPKDVTIDLSILNPICSDSMGNLLLSSIECSRENINGNLSSFSNVSNIAGRWIARDTISSFIKWCRDLGIPQTILFETSGLGK